MSYTPYGKTQKILDRAMEHINSVSYQVSVRWLFYRLLQDGLYKNKKDYVNLVMLTARARKSWYDGWHPATLADETRAMNHAVDFGEEPDPDLDHLTNLEIHRAISTINWHKEQARDYEHTVTYDIDPNYYQDTFCIIMFEARAMAQQFQKHTNGLTLCPFGGQPSIPYKWKIAKHIEEKCRKYSKDATVLYFGDLDDAGETIFQTGKTDITAWCDANVSFVHCGLNAEQAARYQIPENFEHPGNYQWEALTDQQAKEIINESLDMHYDRGATQRAWADARKISDFVAKHVNDFLAQQQQQDE